MRRAQPTPELTIYAERILAELCAKHPIGYMPRIIWKSLRVTAGLADYRHRTIVLSSILLVEEERLCRTLKHEYAHLLAVAKFGLRARGHGKGWRWAMEALGERPEVYHQYEVKRNVAKQEVVYCCSRCGVKIKRKRRLPRNYRVVHARCGGSLKFESVSRLSTEVPHA